MKKNRKQKRSRKNNINIIYNIVLFIIVSVFAYKIYDNVDDINRLRHQEIANNTNEVLSDISIRDEEFYKDNPELKNTFKKEEKEIKPKEEKTENSEKLETNLKEEKVENVEKENKIEETTKIDNKIVSTKENNTQTLDKKIIKENDKKINEKKLSEEKKVSTEKINKNNVENNKTLDNKAKNSITENSKNDTKKVVNSEIKEADKPKTENGQKQIITKKEEIEPITKEKLKEEERKYKKQNKIYEDGIIEIEGNYIPGQF